MCDLESGKNGGGETAKTVAKLSNALGVCPHQLFAKAEPSGAQNRSARQRNVYVLVSQRAFNANQFSGEKIFLLLNFTELTPSPPHVSQTRRTFRTDNAHAEVPPEPMRLTPGKKRRLSFQGNSFPRTRETPPARIPPGFQQPRQAPSVFPRRQSSRSPRPALRRQHGKTG